MTAIADPDRRVYADVSELIASRRDPTAPGGPIPLRRGSPMELYAKLEMFNPFGSIKDRTAARLLRGPRERGELPPGKRLVEPTSGNTGIALAALANLAGVTGVGRYLKEQNPAVRVVAVEPARNHRLPGLKNFQESKQPGILDPSVVDETVRVADEDAYAVAIELARRESLLPGPSSGAILWAAREVARREGGLGVAVAPDGAFKYMSFYASWLGKDGRPHI